MKTLKWQKVRKGWYRAEVETGGLWIHVAARLIGNWWDICATTDKHNCSTANAVRCGYPTKREAQSDAVEMYGTRVPLKYADLDYVQAAIKRGDMEPHCNAFTYEGYGEVEKLEDDTHFCFIQIHENQDWDVFSESEAREAGLIK
jgi:hypothetical protein